MIRGNDYSGYFAIEHFGFNEQFLGIQESAIYLMGLHKRILND